MRGEITLKLLEHISESAGDIADHFVGFLAAGYGASWKKMEYEAARHRRARFKERTRGEREKRVRQRYSLMISRLKREGLIATRKHGSKEVLAVTRRGYFKLKQLKADVGNIFPVPRYQIEPGDKVLIVSFDVPEKDRRKRVWLRSVLKNLGLKMMQQSVWVGKGTLPVDFLEDIKKMRLTDYVEIFEVTKKGSIDTL